MLKFYASVVCVVLTVFCSAPSYGQFSIMPSGADARAQFFNQNILPQAIQLVRQNLAAGVVFDGVASQKLDPNRLFLQTDYTPRIYNVNTGNAGYNNGVEVFVRELSSHRYGGSHHSIFPRIKSVPIGAFVDLGPQRAGTLIDPILNVNGSGSRLFTDNTRNPRNTQQVISYIIGDKGFILISWEDIAGGGDRDYEDVIYVLDLGKENTDRLEEIVLPH